MAASSQHRALSQNAFEAEFAFGFQHVQRGLVKHPGMHGRMLMQDFDMPVECNASGELKAVQEYLARWEERDSWKKSYYTPEQVVAGWQKHLSA